VTFTRRSVLSLPLVAAACASGDPVSGVVAYPERSLEYAPLFLAAKAGLYAEPRQRIALTQRVSGQDVAASVVGGFAAAGALAMPDFIRAVADGAPLIAIGALTRRLDCHLVVRSGFVSPIATLAAIHLGDWRGQRIGLESGPNGTEAFIRFVSLRGQRNARPTPRQLISLEPLSGEARWKAFETSEALTAALADHRVEAFIGRPYAVAQTLTLGSGLLAQTFAGEAESPILTALPTILVAHRDRLSIQPILAPLVSACARAASEFSGASVGDAAMRAMPDRDGLHISLAARLMSGGAVPSGAFAADGKLPLDAIERYVTLSASAGRTLGLNPGTLATTRFSG